MFLDSFKVTGFAIAQLFFLAAIGYLLVKKNLLSPEGLNSLSRLVIELTLPFLIFYRLVEDFNFSLYPNWWLFPLISAIVTVAGLIAGSLFLRFIKGHQHKLQFLSLIAFQNSGYLPLPLVAILLPKEKADSLFVYLFLFLLGFNLIIWSLGVYMLTFSKAKKFELGSLFSPPVIAAIFSLIFIYFGLNKFITEAVIKPLRMVGDCTLPLAMFVVGGNLAQINLRRVDKKAIFFIILVKMIILPLLGMWLIIKFQLPELIGLLILIQLAMPPATSLSVIANHYKKEDLLISQGIFFGHIFSIITIPVFLSLFFYLYMVR